MNKKYLHISAGLILLLVFSCGGSRVVQRKDNLGRVVRISYYERNSVIRSEDISYYGNSHNPQKIFYMQKKGLNLIPMREEVYTFTGGNLSRLDFFKFNQRKRIQAGMIKYYYTVGKPFRIEYYSYLHDFKRHFIFGLDQYTYNNFKLHQRRIIEFEFNRKTGKSMQIGQYVLNYKKGKVLSMQSWIMNKKSKKIIEKKETNIELIDNKIAFIEQFYNNRARSSKYISN